MKGIFQNEIVQKNDSDVYDGRLAYIVHTDRIKRSFLLRLVIIYVGQILPCVVGSDAYG